MVSTDNTEEVKLNFKAILRSTVKLRTAAGLWSKKS